MKQTSDRRRALILSKGPSRWHSLLIKKLGKKYDLKIEYIQTWTKQFGFHNFSHHISGILTSENMQICFLDLEFCFSVGLEELAKIDPSVRLVSFSFDDITFHEINVLQNYPVDLVLAADPVAVAKYREKRIPSELFFLENSGEEFAPLQWHEKKCNVLFFGSLGKGGRFEKINALKATGLQIDLHDTDVNEVSYPELCRLMVQAKVILNFSDSAYDGGRFSFLPFDCFRQFKGRVIEAGLAGAICVSEYAPSIELLFPDGEVPMFEQIAEAVLILNDLLQDDWALQQKAKKFHKIVLENYSEDVQMEKLAAQIAHLPPRGRPVPNWLPNRYVEILLQERVIRPYVVDSWSLKNSAKDFWHLLTGKNLLSFSQRALIFWLIFKVVMGKYLTKPVRLFRKMFSRRLVSSPR